MSFICGFVDKNVKRVYRKYKTLKSLKIYLKYLKQTNASLSSLTENPYPNKIWTMWLQGIDNAPEIVKICIDSIRKHAGGREVIVIDSKNLSKYVNLPEFITNKYNKGIISSAMFSDIVRTYLLYYYGGTWVDSTIYCTDSLEKFNREELCFLSEFNPVGATVISSWYISVQENNNCLLKSLLICLYSYWKKNNKNVDYFLFHLFHKMLIENDVTCNKIWQKVPLYLNSIPKLLLEELSKSVVDKNRIEYIKSITPIHKLTYKNFYENAPRNQQLLLERLKNINE